MLQFTYPQSPIIRNIRYVNTCNKVRNTDPFETLQSNLLSNRLNDELLHSQYEGNMIRLELSAEWIYLIYLIQTALEARDLKLDKFELLDSVMSHFEHIQAKYTLYDPLNTACRITRYLCNDEGGFSLLPPNDAVPTWREQDFVLKVYGTVYRMCCCMAKMFSDIEPLGLKKDYVCVGYDEHALYFHYKQQV